MNTIKEQATVNVTAKYAESYEIGFEAGADYVLGEIEAIVQADLGSYKSQLDRIKNVIEQLKK